VNAAKLRERLELAQKANGEQLAKADTGTKKLTERLQKKNILLQTNKVKFHAKIEAEEAQLQSEEEKLEEKEDALSITKDDLAQSKKELKHNKAELDGAHADLKADQAKLEVLNEKVMSLREELVAAKTSNVELKNANAQLQSDLDAEHKAEEHFNASVKTFQDIGNTVNDTLSHVMEQREHALLISQDLLKVNDKLRGLLLSSMQENSRAKRALLYFYKGKNFTQQLENADQNGPNQTAPDQQSDHSFHLDFNHPNPQSPDSKPSQSPDSKPSQSPDSGASTAPPQQEAATEAAAAPEDSETTNEPRFEEKFTGSDRHTAPISEAARLKELFYGSIASPSRS